MIDIISFALLYSDIYQQSSTSFPEQSRAYFVLLYSKAQVD